MSMLLRRARVPQISATVAVLACAVLGAVQSTAGIQGSGFRTFAAIGPITAVGSGSVSVGGVEYSTGGASVDINGNPGDTTQLHPGDIVTIDGALSAGHGHKDGSAASFVTFSANVRGAVSAVDVPSAILFVLGQTVQVTADTKWDAGIQGSGLQGLQSGAMVEVSGFADAAGNLVATRVGAAAGSRGARVVGTVRNLNPSRHIFDINALVVSYGSAAVSGSLAEGASVVVEASRGAMGSTLAADTVDLQTAVPAEPGAEGRVEGLITDLASPDYFEVEGQPVTVNARTHLNLPVPLGLNVGVKVTGVFDGYGTLIAHKVESESAP